MEDKRRFGRIPFGSPVTLKDSERILKGTLRDLSLKGAKVVLDHGSPANALDLCIFELILTEEIKLCFQARIAYREGQEVGLSFLESDPDSFAHLLRLMELNTGDSDKIEKELHRIEARSYPT